jgi:hypothetical protein
MLKNKEWMEKREPLWLKVARKAIYVILILITGAIFG